MPTIRTSINPQVAGFRTLSYPLCPVRVICLSDASDILRTNGGHSCMDCADMNDKHGLCQCLIKGTPCDSGCPVIAHVPGCHNGTRLWNTLSACRLKRAFSLGFTCGMADASYDSMTMLTAYLMYGETANGSEYRLTLWAYNKAEAMERASAHAQSNRLVYYKVL